MPSGKWFTIGGLWGLALLSSVLLAVAARAHPAPLTPQPIVVALLVLLPPLLMALWLLLHWRLPVGEGGESAGIAQERH
jgi:hypothetical protein